MSKKLNPLNQDQWSTHKTIQPYCKNPDIRILILLEHEGQVKDCLEWLKQIKGQKQVIALSPFAIYELDKQDIPYRLPEDYYDPQELYQLGMDNYQKAENLCAIIDNSIHTACPVTAKLGIKPALFSFHQLKILYDAATIRMSQLFKVINTEKPGAIFIYDSKSYPFGVSEKAPYLLFDNRESIYRHLLALAGWKIPIVVLPHIQQSEEAYTHRKVYQGVSTKLKRKVAGWLQPHPQLLDLVVTVRRRGWHGLYHRLRSYLQTNKKVPILLFGTGYNWDDSREELQSAGIGHIFRMPDYLRHWLSEPSSDKGDSKDILNAWEGLRINSEFRRFFMWDDIDFFPVVEERLRFLVERLTPACLKAYEEASELIENRRIRAVLSSSLSTCMGHSVAQAAHNARIPVVLWQHGAYGYFDWVTGTYNDILPSDFLFAFGEGVVDKYRTVAKHYGTQIVPMGSATLDELCRNSRLTRMRLGLNVNRKVILYVTTIFVQNNLYITFLPPFSDNLLWQTQRSIIDILGKHSEYSIIVKTHPNPMYRETPLRSYTKGKGLENILFIRNEYSFTELLPGADIIVIDLPATTLLQALTTSKPIFAYTGHLHIDEPAQELLERRTFCHCELKDFLAALDKFLSGGSINMDLNDKEFLQRYGTYEGASKVKAAKALLDIIYSYSK